MGTKPNYGTNFVSACVFVRIHLPRPTAERFPLIVAWLNHPHPAEHGLVGSTQCKILIFPSCSHLFSMTKRCLENPSFRGYNIKGHIFTMVAKSLTSAKSREISRFLAEFCTVRFRVGRAKLPKPKHLLAGPLPSTMHAQTPAQPLLNPLRVVFYSDLARTRLSAIYRLIRRLPPHFHYITQNPEREKSPFRARISISTE
jgi:hypothetical protein